MSSFIVNAILCLFIFIDKNIKVEIGVEVGSLDSE